MAQGNVVINRGDSNDALAAAINAPLFPGDYLSTGGASRAEARFDGISLLRLAQNTQARFINLNPGQREAGLAVGTVMLSLLERDGAPRVDTASVSVQAKAAGDYRITVTGEGTTYVTVRSGSASIMTGQGEISLEPGSTLVANGRYDNPSISYERTIAYDGFDRFNNNRDATLTAAMNASQQYLPPALVGYTDFAANGRWDNVPDYGNVWFPQQDANWAPYRDGRWTWEAGNRANREHSRKPEEFYSLVEATCPGSKMELFARQKRQHWQALGCETERFKSDGTAASSGPQEV